MLEVHSIFSAVNLNLKLLRTRLDFEQLYLLSRLVVVRVTLNVVAPRAPARLRDALASKKVYCAALDAIMGIIVAKTSEKKLNFSFHDFTYFTSLLFF